MIQMDSNSKLGVDFISRDPLKQSDNGKLLGEIIRKHIVTNGVTEKVKGLITRRREIKESIKKSIIDHLIIIADLEKDFESLIVDGRGEKSCSDPDYKSQK